MGSRTHLRRRCRWPSTCWNPRALCRRHFGLTPAISDHVPLHLDATVENVCRTILPTEVRDVDSGANSESAAKAISHVGKAQRMHATNRRVLDVLARYCGRCRRPSRDGCRQGFGAPQDHLRALSARSGRTLESLELFPHYSGCFRVLLRQRGRPAGIGSRGGSFLATGGGTDLARLLLDFRGWSARCGCWRSLSCAGRPSLSSGTRRLLALSLPSPPGRATQQHEFPVEY